MGLELCLGRMYLNDLRAHYTCARFSSATTKTSKSILAPQQAFGSISEPMLGVSRLSTANVQMTSTVLVPYILIYKKKNLC